MACFSLDNKSVYLQVFKHKWEMAGLFSHAISTFPFICLFETAHGVFGSIPEV
jgi:hypothetical protein